MYEAAHKTPGWLTELVGTWPAPKLRTFMRWVTGSTSMPGRAHDGDGLFKIEIVFYPDPTYFPMSKTCVYQMHLPEYPDMETLVDKLDTSMEVMAMGEQ